ncbi:isoleucine--tRNA ligase [Okeania sp. KiyG1]|uniref:isoleucine--tRNA ligase n=1 Tax=Okeania sp. KiyG1 TaxID=2720165 RepID=UPI0019226DB6|nr:isoleucine--tRNA ligase [Okeania sp. KiyG1]GGA00597.1 isoleucine--tRNA ligase [Okeania sp. KiyG1]
MVEAKSYKDTVNLPQTKFNMRANSVTREPELQKFWAESQIYERLSQTNPGEIFTLHDGPPYANGNLHIGHAMNKILKDIINRYQILQGRKVRYVPGWDCHGLPIELKVIQNLKSAERGKLTPIELRQKARDFALETVDKQRESFKRYGVWGDWEHPYMTLTPEYEAAQIGVFGKMVLKGYIYRGLKPVHWSPSSKTALAEAELEYPEGHTSQSIYAAFKITKLAKAVQKSLKPYLEKLWVAIWTTTPWTIPGNLAVSVNPDLDYAVVKPGADYAMGEDKLFIVAAEAVERLSATLGTTLTPVATVKGQDLENCTYQHPLFERESNIVIGGDYVTTDSGTGLVHTAPGHGQEDYIVGQRYSLPILSPVDGNGKFTAEAGEFSGLNVLKEGNVAIIEALQNANSLLKEEPYEHKYPYDWRTKKPTIFRATEQWFASVEGFRNEALKAIADVQWIPAQGENRITPMVSDRSDWCISRQRSWGVPIPVFYEEKTGEPLLTEETIAHVQKIVAEKGSDAWWEMSVEELLPEKYRSDADKYRKGTDTMDVWFDSGSSWAAVAQQRDGLKYPVDIYLEGSDQHRGWFQSSLLTSIATNGVAPYKTVLTHGFVLDENGRKMSKSLGNVVDPSIVIEGGNNKKQEPPYGADILRLWVSSVDYSSDVPLGKNILKQIADIYRKIRNTARFLLGNIHDFDPKKDAVAYEEMPELDRYMLHRMTEVFAEVKDGFEKFQYFRFFQTIQNFCVVDLSNFYLDIAKDRLYISATDAYRRRSCQTVLAVAVENLAKAIAPVLPHMAEDIWQNIPYPTSYKSVFESGWVKMESKWHNPELAKLWEELRKTRTEVNKVLEKARAEKAIGAPLEAKVLLYVKDAELREQIQTFNPIAKAEKSQSEFLEAKIETEPETTENKTPNNQGKSPANFAQAKNFLSEFIEILSKVFSGYQKVLGAVFFTIILLLLIRVTLTVLITIHQLPVVSSIMELVGIICTIRFVTYDLLFAKNRQKLSEKIKFTTEDIFGKDVLLPPKRKKSTENTVKQSAILVSPEGAYVPPKKVDLIPVAQVVETETLPQQPDNMKAKIAGNGVDELRYLFITSQVELLDSPEALSNLEYKSISDSLGVGVVKADGEKCDRCWNYSTHVGISSEDPTICERCVAALAGEF